MCLGEFRVARRYFCRRFDVSSVFRCDQNVPSATLGNAEFATIRVARKRGAKRPAVASSAIRRPKHILRNCPFVTPLLPWLHSFRLASCCSPSIFSSVGAFALSRTSKDAALVMTLEPGNYTAQVRSDTAGEVLLEVYFVD